MRHKTLLQLSPEQKFWLKHLFPAFVFTLLMLLVYPHTHWDIRLTDMFFDVQQHEFMLRHDVFLSQWMHAGLKWLMVSVAVVCLVLALASYKLAQFAAYRESLL